MKHQTLSMLLLLCLGFLSGLAVLENGNVYGRLVDLQFCMGGEKTICHGDANNY